MFRTIALTLAAALPLAPATFSQTPTDAATKKPALTAGMTAPAMTIEKWVKGAPVKAFEPGKVYVVEFWATWCGPCIASMPHLSELQRKYKDKLTIIGVSSVDKNNSLEKVEKMVTEKGDGMGYTVAWDVERTTSTAFMKAAERNGIPCSFLVDGKGNVAYIGHPLFLDEPIARVLDGSWNAATEAASYEALQNEYWKMRAGAKKDPQGTLAFATKFEKEHPHLVHLVTQMKFDAALAAGDMATVRTVGGKLVDEAIAAKNAATLNQIAWGLVDPDAKLEKRELELAIRAANAAVEITARKDGTIIDTLARCYAWKGDYAKAIELQTEAIAAAPEQMKAQLQAALDEYRKASGK